MFTIDTALAVALYLFAVLGVLVTLLVLALVALCVVSGCASARVEGGATPADVERLAHLREMDRCALERDRLLSLEYKPEAATISGIIPMHRSTPEPAVDLSSWPAAADVVRR